VLDQRWIRSLHVETMRHADLPSDLHVELPPHVGLDSQRAASSTRAAIERVERGG
jgi:hypothetical protein